MHWSEPFIGRPYVEGEFDCAVLAEEAVKAATGRTIALPKERADNWRGYTRQILDARDTVADQVPDPIDGDGVLMIGRARLNHIGVFCEIDGTGYVLHANQDFSSVVRTRLRDLERFGHKVEGFYRWK